MRIYNSAGVEKYETDELRVMSNSAFHPSSTVGYAVAGLVNATALTTGAIAANILYAFPIIAPPLRVTLKMLGFNVTTLSAGNARIGLYRNKAYNDLYPGELLADSGDISTGSTGVKQFNPATAIPLTPGEMYWLALVGNATPTLRALAMASIYPTLGLPAAGGTALQVGYSVAHAYAALPNPFTAAATILTAVPLPALFYQAD